MGKVVRIDAQVPAIMDIPGNLILIIYSGIAILDFKTTESEWQHGNLTLMQIGDYSKDKDLASLFEGHEITYLTGTAALNSIEANGGDSGWAVDATSVKYDRNLMKAVMDVALAVKKGSINRISYRVTAIVRK